MHIPHKKRKSGQGGSTTVLQEKNSFCPQFLILSTGHFGQFYNSTGICIYPLNRENPTRVAKLQFYKEKKASLKKIGFWPLDTLATLANSTILQEYAHTPSKEKICPWQLNYSSTIKKTLLFKFCLLSTLTKRLILQFFRNKCMVLLLVWKLI